MTMKCEYCKTNVDVGDKDFIVERTMDMKPPSKVAWIPLGENGFPAFDQPFLHFCKKGKNQYDDEP